jgi:hypothetical protein
MLLAACGPKAASAVPERRSGKGGYLDEIVFSVVDKGSAITQLQAGRNRLSFGPGRVAAQTKEG